jgi:hypothetical protein
MPTVFGHTSQAGLIPAQLVVDVKEVAAPEHIKGVLSIVLNGGHVGRNPAG